MYSIKTHELTAQELCELPDVLQGQMFRLIERLEQEGQLRIPHGKVIGGGIFELRVGGKDIARTLYAYADGKTDFFITCVF